MQDIEPKSAKYVAEITPNLLQPQFIANANGNSLAMRRSISSLNGQHKTEDETNVSHGVKWIYRI